MRVTIARDGQEALEKLQEKKYHLVLMDLNMPVMDGCEATSRIRSKPDPYFQALPILAYTGSPAADSKEKAESLGMNDFIAKPLNPAEMHFKIRHYLGLTPDDKRTLNLKLDDYGHDDTAFLHQLLTLMVKNLRELQDASFLAFESGELRTFHSILHKVKSTVILIGDSEYTYAVDDLKECFIHRENGPELGEKLEKFNYLTESIVAALKRRIAAINNI